MSVATLPLPQAPVAEPRPGRIVRVVTRRKALKTDIAVISDVHLGSAVSRIDKLRRALREWYPFGRLIILGDLFDDLDFRRLRPVDYRFLRDLRELGNRLPIDWIEGNHDEAGRDLIPAIINGRGHVEMRLHIAKENYLFIHGHQFDTFITEHPVVSHLAASFYEVVQRNEGEQNHVSRWLKKRSKTWMNVCRKVEERAITYARGRGADIIMCGHTHYHNALTHVEGDSVRYVNTGCWTDNPSTLVCIDREGPRRVLYT